MDSVMRARIRQERLKLIAGSIGFAGVVLIASGALVLVVAAAAKILFWMP